MTSYNDMPLDSRVWVYQSSRKLADDEIKSIREKTNAFLEEWTAHGTKLKACLEIRHNIFLLMLVDEKQAMASGCSIDKSVHVMLGLEHEFGISLTNRMLFAYKNTNGEIFITPKSQFEQLIKTGAVNDETTVFNTLIKNKSELETEFEIPFEKSWHKNLVSV